MTVLDRPGRTRRRTPLLALLAVSTITHVGTRVSAIAIPWFVLAITGSPTLTGLVAACELGPYVVCKALGGPLTDRLGQRRVSMVADLGSAAVMGAIPLLHHLHLLPLGVLLSLVAVTGALRGPGDNAKHTAVPLVTDLAQWPLERSTGLFGAIERGSGLVAPGVAAVMITVFSAPGAIAVTAGCFACSAVLVAAFLPRCLDGPSTDDDQVVARPVGGETPTGYLHQLREGFTFLRRDRLLVLLVLMIMVTNLIDVAKTSVLLPVWAQRGDHGVEAMSLLLTCMAGFSMVSSLLASWIGHRLPRKATYFLCFLVAGPMPYVVLGLDWAVWQIAGVYCVAGFASGFLNPLLGAIFFERIPRPLLGRVGGLADATAWAGMPLGGLVAGGLVALVGLSPAFFVLGGIYLATTVITGLLAGDRFDRPDRVAGDLSSAPATPRQPAVRSGPPCPPDPVRFEPDP